MARFTCSTWITLFFTRPDKVIQSLLNITWSLCGQRDIRLFQPAWFLADPNSENSSHFRVNRLSAPRPSEPIVRARDTSLPGISCTQ